MLASSFPQLVKHVQTKGLTGVAPLRREDFARMQCSTGPAFGHATRCFGHNSQTLDLFVESSAFQVVGFSMHLSVVQGLPLRSATMPDHSGGRDAERCNEARSVDRCHFLAPGPASRTGGLALPATVGVVRIPATAARTTTRQRDSGPTTKHRFPEH